MDQQAEAKLKQGLSQIFPEAGFIAEETAATYGDVGNGYYWVIDPLDGTTNFLHKLPVFAVSVGLIFEKQPILGLIYEPNRDELFTAFKGNGAHLNGSSIRVSPENSLSKSLLATGFPYYDFSYQDQYLALLNQLSCTRHQLMLSDISIQMGLNLRDQ